MKNDTYTISANDIEIWAKIGLHPEEANLENCFRINVQVNAIKSPDFNHFLNYESIIDVVRLVFSRPHKILENICEEIIAELRLIYSGEIATIECEIKKMNPAVKGLKVGALIVKIKKEF